MEVYEGFMEAKMPAKWQMEYFSPFLNLVNSWARHLAQVLKQNVYSNLTYSS